MTNPARAPSPPSPSPPDLGVGAGLRARHYSEILDGESPPSVGFFEAISENYLGRGGRPLYELDRIAERYPVVLHGVSLSIGAPEEPDRDYLRRIRDLARRTGARWVSDHVCYGSASGVHLHDLLPLPFTEDVLRRVVRRAREIQDFLELPFALENTSSYLTYTESRMSEAEFFARLGEEADVSLLLDVNNVFVSAKNHDFSATEFLERIPPARVLQIHLAGHTDRGAYLLDTHRGPVASPVLALYEDAIARLGPISTLVEWDEAIPPWRTLEDEMNRVAVVRSRGLGRRPS